jgi:alpha-glucosidase
MLSMALPGSMYVYQGEELGLPEVEDIPDHLRQDPMWRRSGGVDPGRDGCRVPIPWSGSQPPYGFSPGATKPWLDQPDNWAALTVETEDHDPASMLNLYRTGLHMRRTALTNAVPSGEVANLEWLPSQPSVLTFARGERFVCLVNFGAESVPLPDGAEILLASSELVAGAVPQDTTVWLYRGRREGPSDQGKEGQ